MRGIRARATVVINEGVKRSRRRAAAEEILSRIARVSHVTAAAGN